MPGESVNGTVVVPMSMIASAPLSVAPIALLGSTQHVVAVGDIKTGHALVAREYRDEYQFGHFVVAAISVDIVIS